MEWFFESLEGYYLDTTYAQIIIINIDYKY